MGDDVGLERHEGVEASGRHKGHLERSRDDDAHAPRAVAETADDIARSPDLLGGEVRGQHHRDDGIGETRRPRHGGRPSVDRGDALLQVMCNDRRGRGAGDAEPGAPALLKGEGHGEPGQAGGVVHGPVEWVDDPARALARSTRARLLGEDRGSRRQRPQALDDKLLGGKIRRGHDVAMLLAGDANILPLHGDE